MLGSCRPRRKGHCCGSIGMVSSHDQCERYLEISNLMQHILDVYIIGGQVNPGMLKKLMPT